MTNDNHSDAEPKASDAVAEVLELIRLMLEGSPYRVEHQDQPVVKKTRAE
jgi:hypothetical protein